MIYVEPLESLPPGNMFHHDLFSCGTVLGHVFNHGDMTSQQALETFGSDRVIAVTKSLDPKSECPFVIIHNEATGERVAICFSEEAKELVAKNIRFQKISANIKRREEERNEDL